MEKELVFQEVEVWEGKYVEVDKNRRIYFNIETYNGSDLKQESGFSFVALECVGWECDGKNEYNFAPKSNVEIIVEGSAAFDGIRHLFYGSEKSDNYGYHYYANLPKIIEVLTELRKLEVKYCRGHELEQQVLGKE